MPACVSVMCKDQGREKAQCFGKWRTAAVVSCLKGGPGKVTPASLTKPLLLVHKWQPHARFLTLKEFTVQKENRLVIRRKVSLKVSWGENIPDGRRRTGWWRGGVQRTFPTQGQDVPSRLCKHTPDPPATSARGPGVWCWKEVVRWRPARGQSKELRLRQEIWLLSQFQDLTSQMVLRK